MSNNHNTRELTADQILMALGGRIELRLTDENISLAESVALRHAHAKVCEAAWWLIAAQNARGGLVLT